MEPMVRGAVIGGCRARRMLDPGRVVLVMDEPSLSCESVLQGALVDPPLDFGPWQGSHFQPTEPVRPFADDQRISDLRERGAGVYFELIPTLGSLDGGDLAARLVYWIDYC